MKSFSELTSASFVSNSDILAISQENSGTYSSKKTTVKEVSDFANQNFAEEYDSTSSYAVGDYVIYESVLYKCIASTTGTFDSTKWTSVVVTDEMESGGGGTGGHTIIDENGNSMTARAGLQFVGGANVSDDSTNNKTIVDLASAGGIDGVFVDTDNVIVPETTYSGSLSYTATEDCVVFVNVLATSSGSGWVYIDNKVVGRTYFVGTAIINGAYYLLKKGQTLTAYSQTYSGIDITYAVYGIQTGTTHSKFQPVIYSTEERVIGVWTDGKPLYEKTYLIGDSTISTNLLSNLNIETAVNIYVIDYSDNTQINYNLSYNTSTKLIGNIPSGQHWFWYLMVRYTKTSDVAGSGTWTPQGVPAVHYSTDEQIIGTYLGETLYQRTFDLGSDLLVSTSSWTTLGITLDADKIIETKTTSTSGSFQGNILVYNDNGTWKGQTPRNGNDSSHVRYLTIAYTKSS